MDDVKASIGAGLVGVALWLALLATLAGAWAP